jgi:hypothetical protein
MSCSISSSVGACAEPYCGRCGNADGTPPLLGGRAGRLNPPDAVLAPAAYPVAPGAWYG